MTRGFPSSPSRRKMVAGLWLLGLLCNAGQVKSSSGIYGLGQISSPETNSSEKTSPQPPQDDIQLLERLESYMQRGQFQGVQEQLRSYLESHPNSARAYYDLGYVCFRTHQLRASVEALAKSLQLDLSNAEAHKILALNLIMIGKPNEAQRELEEAARLKPNSAEIHYFLGRIHYTRNAFQLAKQEFEEAIRLDPSYTKAYDSLGLTMEGMGDDDAALANYAKAFELMERQGRKSEWPYINACAMYNRRNEPERALPYCQQAIQTNPKNDGAFFEAARAYMAQQNWEKAAAALRSAIENNPRHAKYHYALSTVYRKTGKITESKNEAAIFQKLSGHGAVQHPQESTDGARLLGDDSTEVIH